MKRNVLGILAAIPLLLGSSLAFATATYQWDPISAGEGTPPGTEFLTTGGTLKGQSFVYDIDAASYDPSVNYGSPFSLLELEFNGTAADFHLGPNLSGNVGAVYVSMDMHPIANGLLAGSLYANDGETDFSMSSTDGTWTFDSVNSDFPGPCFAAPGCTGGSGSWVLMAVPEPPNFFLCLGGLAGMLLLSRHRRRCTRVAG